MNPPNTGTTCRFPAISASVSRDFLALASHMSDCQQSQGHFFVARSALESLQTLASPRIVTTGTLVSLCTLALWAFA